MNLVPDTLFINQPMDTMITHGIQWMGTTDMSYMNFRVDYNDSTYISLSTLWVTGGLESPYPSPAPYPMSIVFLQPSIPANTVINASVDFWQGNVVDTCSLPLTFIMNPSSVSVSEINIPKIEARLFPNPMTNSATIEVSEDIKAAYTLSIYDIMGRKIYSSDRLNTKTHVLNRSLIRSSGVYFIEIESDRMKPKLIKLLLN